MSIGIQYECHDGAVPDCVPADTKVAELDLAGAATGAAAGATSEAATGALDVAAIGAPVGLKVGTACANCWPPIRKACAFPKPGKGPEYGLGKLLALPLPQENRDVKRAVDDAEGSPDDLTVNCSSGFGDGAAVDACDSIFAGTIDGIVNGRIAGGVDAACARGHTPFWKAGVL